MRRASRRRAWLRHAAAALALGAGTVALASEVPRPAEPDLRAAYLGAVERWAAGDDSVVDAWADWIADELARLRDQVPALVAGAPPAVLHDAVCLHVLAAHAAAQHERLALWRLHLEMAEAVLAQIVASPAGGPPLDASSLRRDVALARGYELLRRWQPSFALDAFKRALGAQPGDADALLAAGMAEELRVVVPALALDRYVTAPDIVNSGAADVLVPLPSFQRLDRDKSLHAAESFLRRALAAEPALAEARVRLGRVLAAAGRNDDAEREWRGALERSHGDAACLAHLFLGRAAERRRDWRDAVGHYRAALAESPAAQSAHMALSAALEGLGDGAGARGHARASLSAATPEARSVDPWLRYHFEPQRGLGALLARLAGRSR